jgi:hypothetical protein
LLAAPSSTVAGGTAVWLDVDDTSAIYPLTIDPLVQDAQLAASDGAAGEMGDDGRVEVTDLDLSPD